MIHSNMERQMQYDRVKKQIEAQIQQKSSVLEQSRMSETQWDKKYVENLYQDKPGTMLDFFFMDREKRGYEWGVMRQNNTDLKTQIPRGLDFRKHSNRNGSPNFP